MIAGAITYARQYNSYIDFDSPAHDSATPFPVERLVSSLASKLPWGKGKGKRTA